MRWLDVNGYVRQLRLLIGLGMDTAVQIPQEAEAPDQVGHLPPDADLAEKEQHNAVERELERRHHDGR